MGADTTGGGASGAGTGTTRCTPVGACEPAPGDRERGNSADGRFEAPLTAVELEAGGGAAEFTPGFGNSETGGTDDGGEDGDEPASN